MRTKTLLLTAALGAGLTTMSQAQVFSVNAVGYVNVDLVPGFNLVCNPLNAADNTLGALITGVDEGTQIYTFDGTFNIDTFEFGAWGNPGVELLPGGGFFLRTAAAATVTFVGEVMQGDLSNAVPAGFAIRSSQVPQEGGITTVLGFPADEGDQVYIFDGASQGYDIRTFEFGEWTGGEPTLGVGQAVFTRSVAAKSWDRSFNIN